ncbi:MAG: TolC family protein [Acidobacteria bacterium]|nr:TolC family protein [Acidobacteriota bacterium]
MRILAILAVPLLLPAQETTLPLSLRKSLEIALAPEGSTKVEIAQEAIVQAEARKNQARAALLPHVDGSISYQSMTRNLRAFGIDFPTIPGFHFSTFAGPFTIFDARANATQSLLDLSSIKRYQAAKSAREASKLDRDQTKHLVTDQVARAYLAALRAEAHLASAKANVELAEALLKLADSQRKAGTGTGIEVTRAAVQLANEKGRLTVAENERNRAHLQLLRAMDLKLETKLELTDKLEYSVPQPVSMEQATELALKDRADYKAQRQREQTARLSYQATSWERLPSAAAFADYGAIGGAVNDSRATRSVGISVRIPIFDGGRREARRAESGSQLRVEEIHTRDLRQQLELELRLAFDSLRSAETQVQSAEEALQLAQKELEQAERRYKAGVANSLEITDAQTRLTRARETRVNALFAHNLAKLDLGSALGVVERYLP